MRELLQIAFMGKGGSWGHFIPGSEASSDTPIPLLVSHSVQHPWGSQGQVYMTEEEVSSQAWMQDLRELVELRAEQSRSLVG